MVSIWPRTMSCEPRGRSLRLASTMRLMSRGHAAQVAILHRAENIDRALNIVVRDHRHARCRGWCWRRRPGSPDRRAAVRRERDIAQIAQAKRSVCCGVCVTTL